MEGAMHCKLRTKRRLNKLREIDSETKGSNNIQMTKPACLVEAHESTRNRLESTLPKDHEDRIAEKGFNSSGHYHLVHKFGPMPQAMGQRMGEARTVASVAIDQGEEQKRSSFLKHSKRKRKSTLLH